MVSAGFSDIGISLLSIALSRTLAGQNGRISLLNREEYFAILDRKPLISRYKRGWQSLSGVPFRTDPAIRESSCSCCLAPSPFGQVISQGATGSATGLKR